MRIHPYLFFNGDCEAACRWYAEVLGGTVEAMLPHTGTPAEEHVPPEWRSKIMHASIAIGDQRLMASDAPPGRQQSQQGHSVSLNIDDVAEAERIFAALSEGGAVTMPIQETFWALRFGMCTDRYGTPWMINCSRPDAQ